MAYKKIIFFCHDLFSYLNSSVAIIGGKHAAQPGLAKPLSVEGAGSLKKPPRCLPSAALIVLCTPDMGVNLWDESPLYVNPVNI